MGIRRRLRAQQHCHYVPAYHHSVPVLLLVVHLHELENRWTRGTREKTFDGTIRDVHRRPKNQQRTESALAACFLHLPKTSTGFDSRFYAVVYRVDFYDHVPDHLLNHYGRLHSSLGGHVSMEAPDWQWSLAFSRVLPPDVFHAFLPWLWKAVHFRLLSRCLCWRSPFMEHVLHYLFLCQAGVQGLSYVEPHQENERK